MMLRGSMMVCPGVMGPGRAERRVKLGFQNWCRACAYVIKNRTGTKGR